LFVSFFFPFILLFLCRFFVWRVLVVLCCVVFVPSHPFSCFYVCDLAALATYPLFYLPFSFRPFLPSPTTYVSTYVSIGEKKIADWLAALLLALRTERLPGLDTSRCRITSCSETRSRSLSIGRVAREETVAVRGQIGGARGEILGCIILFCSEFLPWSASSFT
jgi:hypothetical protein